MSKHITASPLTWPEGWIRSEITTQSRFGKWNAAVSIAKGTRFILDELQRMGIPDYDVIISTDLRLKNNGLPYSTQSEPEDKGVAVWWKDGDEQRVIALDKYDRIGDNLWAIGKTIEAMRGIERWGGGEILNRTFKGFTALPDPDSIGQAHWRDLLEIDANATLEDAERNFRKLSMNGGHPDNGGSTKRFIALKDARDQARSELR